MIHTHLTSPSMWDFMISSVDSGVSGTRLVSARNSSPVSTRLQARSFINGEMTQRDVRSAYR